MSLATPTTHGPDAEGRVGGSRRPLIAWGVLGACLAWEYWPTLLEMAHRWSTDPRYSHGYLVPLFAAYLAWTRVGAGPVAVRPSPWGLALIAVGSLLHYAGTYYFLETIAAVAILPSVAGLVVLLAGWGALRRTWVAIAFLVFMLPLPYQLEVALSGPLQRLATKASTYLLQTLGLPALAEGNVIHMDGIEIGVVEACSGLSMMYTFFALSAGLALVIRRPLLDRALVVAAAVPIALASNVARVTLTGVLHEVTDARTANAFYHDLAGWLMMPLALGLLQVELLLLSRLLIEPGPVERPFSPTLGASPNHRPAQGRRPGRPVTG
jgi:exosortase